MEWIFIIAYVVSVLIAWPLILATLTTPKPWEWDMTTKVMIDLRREKSYVPAAGRALVWPLWVLWLLVKPRLNWAADRFAVMLHP